MTIEKSEERKALLGRLDEAAQSVEMAHAAIRDAKSAVVREECALSNAETAYRKIALAVHNVLPSVPEEVKGEPVG